MSAVTAAGQGKPRRSSICRPDNRLDIKQLPLTILFALLATQVHLLRANGTSIGFNEGLMKWLLRLFDVIFGCWHRNVSRVFTIGGQTYRVCCDCGAKFSYSLATMSIMRSTPATRVNALQRVRTSFGAE